jgi:peptide chain release factor 2
MEIKDKDKVINESKEKIERLKGYIELDKKEKRLEEVGKELENPDLWNDRKKSISLSKEKKIIEDDIALFNKVYELFSELEVLKELESEGENIHEDFEKIYGEFEKEYKKAELVSVFKSPEDQNPAYLTIHPGAGGTESQDWAEMLLRMYLRWAERRKFSSEIVEIQPGDEAGIKSATLRIGGEYVYGFLKTEIGIHRLIRISPFDSNKRRHTSFVAIFVYPEVDDSIDIDINEKDLRIDTFRASGHGGQHVNKTDSAVRITHIPTGVVATCQSERSQHKNKAMAMKLLKARLFEIELKKKEEEREKTEKNKSDIAWGNQIRTYTLHPFKLIKDHRTGVEIGDTQKVLDGELDELMAAALLKGVGKKG